MSSFYGGKQGKSYNIVERFDTVSAMITQFRKGDGYSDVSYGEYVIIDTINKHNHQNGLIFRRDFYYNEDVSSNPEPNPNTRDKDSWDYEEKIFEQGQTPSQGVDYDFSEGSPVKYYKYTKFNRLKFFEKKYLPYLKKGVGGGAKYVGQIVGPQGEMSDLNIMTWGDFQDHISAASSTPTSTNYGGLGEIILTSTRMGNQTGGDAIKAGYVNILNGQGDIQGCYISFDFPNPVIQIEGEEIVPYFNEVNSDSAEIEGTVYNYHTFSDGTTATLSSASLIALNPNTGSLASTPHPFYHKFNVAIPKGKDGTSLTEVYITTKENNDWTLDYKLKDYSQTSQGIISTYSAGAYRVINQITAEKRRSELVLSPNSTYYIGNIISTVVAEGNNSTTHSFVCISSGVTAQQSQLLPASAINASVGYEFKIDNSSKWRKINLPDKTLTQLNINYTAGQDKIINLENLDYITLADNGDFYATYTGGTTSKDQNDDIVIASTSSTSLLGHTKQIDNIGITNEISNGYDYSENTTLKVKYKDNSEFESNPFNTVLDVKAFGDRIGVLYSDPDVRNNLSGIIHTANWTDPISGSTYSDMQYADVGRLQGQWHVGGLYSFQDIAIEGEDITDPPDYPSIGADEDTQDLGLNGFHDSPYNGWLITIERPGVGNTTVRALYAFDLNRRISKLTPYEVSEGIYSYWYEVESFDKNDINPESVILVGKDSSNESWITKLSNLQEDGVWLVVTQS